MSSGNTRRASSGETANPTLVPAPATATPVTSPSIVTSGPPLLPGSNPASVWTVLGIEKPVCSFGSDRFRPLTMPEDTEDSSPKGLPSASTSVPTAGIESTNDNGRAYSGMSVDSTARSA